MCAISRLKVQPAKFSSFFQWLRRLTRPNQASQHTRIGGGLRCKFRDLWEAFSCSVCIGQSRCETLRPRAPFSVGDSVL
jgi:hypothetical protein